MTLGRLVYLLYFRPLALVRQSIREGGPINQAITRWGRLAMQEAALQLQPAPYSHSPSRSLLQVHVLSGRRFWYQTVFCLRSFIAHAHGASIQPIIYDDGTLDSYHNHLLRIFPSATFVSYAESTAKLKQNLPKTKFPHLHERWHNYPNIRKLIDPHLGSSGWKLVLDSDMLFFRRPTALLDWLTKPVMPMHMLDVEESYGYNRVALSNLAGADLPDRLNAGICGLSSEQLDWEQMENWIKNLHQNFGSSYYLEQALVAMLLSARPCAIAPAGDYVTWPDSEETHSPKGVMHHYVAESKIDYFRYGWKACLSRMLHGCSGR